VANWQSVSVKAFWYGAIGSLRFLMNDIFRNAYVDLTRNEGKFEHLSSNLAYKAFFVSVFLCREKPAICITFLLFD